MRRYTAAKPASYEWPVPEAREVSHEVGGATWVWRVPEGWVDAPEVPQQLIADYRFPGSDDSLPGRMTVSMIKGEAGGVQANAMRWLQQLYVTTTAGLGPEDEIHDPVVLPAGFTTFVELAGQYQGPHMPTHLAGAIIQVPSEDGTIVQTWFFKLVGDAKTVEKNQEKLLRLIFGFRVKGTELPPLYDKLFDQPGELLTPPDAEREAVPEGEPGQEAQP